MDSFERMHAVYYEKLNIVLWDRNYTNRPHSQKASENDFHGPLGQALPLSSRVSLARPVLSWAHYFQAPTTQASICSETWEITLKWQNHSFVLCQTNMSPKHYIKHYKPHKWNLENTLDNKFSKRTIAIHFNLL